MVNIIKEELSLEESLRKKIEFICDFTNNKPTIIANILLYIFFHWIARFSLYSYLLFTLILHLFNIVFRHFDEF